MNFSTNKFVGQRSRKPPAKKVKPCQIIVKLTLYTVRLTSNDDPLSKELRSQCSDGQLFHFYVAWSPSASEPLHANKKWTNWSWKHGERSSLDESDGLLRIENFQFSVDPLSKQTPEDVSVYNSADIGPIWDPKAPLNSLWHSRSIWHFKF